MLTIVDAFLTTPWSQAPRHQRRIDILTGTNAPACRRRCRGLAVKACPVGSGDRETRGPRREEIR